MAETSILTWTILTLIHIINTNVTTEAVGTYTSKGVESILHKVKNTITHSDHLVVSDLCSDQLVCEETYNAGSVILTVVVLTFILFHYAGG